MLIMKDGKIYKKIIKKEEHMSEKEMTEKETAGGKMDRRNFLTIASAGVAATMMSTTLAKAAGQSSAKQIPNEQGPFDLVVSGGKVVDPETGDPDSARAGGTFGGSSPSSRVGTGCS